MKRLAIAVCVLALEPLGAFAWEEPPEGVWVLMTAGCSGGDVVLSIDFTVTQEPDAHFTGWVIESSVLGLCVDDVYVTDVMPWPSIGESSLQLTVTPRFPDRDEVYRIWGITDTGAETFVAWPQRHNFAHAECLPGPTTVGYITTQGIFPGYPHFEPCEDDCWPPLGFWDQDLPLDLLDLADTGQLVDIYGEYQRGMEGYYIYEPTWLPSSRGCSTVATPELHWGGLKALYR